MYRLLFTSFFRTRIFAVSMALLLALGAIGILTGKHYLVKQGKAMVAAVQFQEKSIANNLEYHKDDLGLLLYYLRFTLIKRPGNISAISIGQSDVNPLMQAVTIRGLEGQKYDTDFENPALLMFGNLDLGFVIIYLFPLVMIAMMFNLYSEESELGTWRILAVQTTSKMGFLLKKMGVRALFVLIPLLLLFLLAGAILKIPFDQNFLALVLLGIVYLCFWGALCILVVSFKRNSSFNALALTSIWVVLTILLPAVVNNYVLNTYQVPEALRAMVEQRDGYHEKWDLEKNAAMNGFFGAYPQFREYPVPQDRFSWIWYYAMQHMGDMESHATSVERTNKILMRNKVSGQIARFIPPLHAQLSFNKLVGTDMASHMDFLDALTDFHTDLRLAFYPKIFDGASADTIDWEKYHAKYFGSKRDFSWPWLLLPTLAITLLIGFLGLMNLRKL